MSTVGRVRPGSMRGTPASQQKIAERLTILNERAPGMMTRLYNLKNQVRIRHIKSEGLVSIVGVFVLTRVPHSQRYQGISNFTRGLLFSSKNINRKSDIQFLSKSFDNATHSAKCS